MRDWKEELLSCNDESSVRMVFFCDAILGDKGRLRVPLAVR